MKILVIGDFHGKFPEKLKKEAKKVDLVISLGDFSPFSLKKEFFKHCYKKKGVELWEVVGKQKYKKSTLKDLKIGEKIVNELNKLPAPVVSVLGNYDHPADDAMDYKKFRSKTAMNVLGFKDKFFKKLIQRSENIFYLDYKAFRFKDFVFIGARGHSSPGHVKSNAYRKHRKILDRLFKKYKKENIIFVTHISPYETKLDKITDKNAPAIARGKHYGSKMFKRIIKKWQPLLNVSGHFHENQGKDKVGNTLLVNAGPALEGNAVILDIDDKNSKKIKVNFIK